MRKSAAALHPASAAVVWALLLALVPICTSSADGGGLLITEVSPSEEGFTLTNFGGTEVGLAGHSVTDGEGTVSFKSGSLAAGESITVAKAASGWFSSRVGTLHFDSASIEKKGRFILADGGDELSLAYAGKVVDAVCYGSSKGAEGWNGKPVPIRSGEYLRRTSLEDTDSAADWSSTKPGRTSLTFSVRYDAVVEPFSFPESGGMPVYRVLESAERSIDISIYFMSCPNVYALLLDRIAHGVSVRVLVEGQPLGADTGAEMQLLRAVEDAGGDARIINPPGANYRRYAYAHGKYAVVDGDTVVITSENWTPGNMGYGQGNRGWGSVVESEGYASYMHAVFENDFDTKWGDVAKVSDVYPSLEPYPGALVYERRSDRGNPSHPCTVSPAVSPDCSAVALRALMSSAEERIYAEVMDIGSSISSSRSDGPVFWMAEAAGRGATAELIIDASCDDADGKARAICMATGIEAITKNGGEGYSLIHNKGVVIDGGVWIASVNWTEASFGRNREAAAFIDSREVSDFFASLFEEDFGVNIHTVRRDGLGMESRVVPSESGYKVILAAHGPTGYSYEWSLGDGTSRTTGVGTAVFDSPGAGSYTATVRLAGTDVRDSTQYEVPRGGEGGESLLIYLAAAIVLSLGTVVSVLRERLATGGRRGSLRR